MGRHHRPQSPTSRSDHQESRYLEEAVGEKDEQIAERTERIVQAGIDDGTFRAGTDARIATSGSPV